MNHTILSISGVGELFGLIDQGYWQVLGLNVQFVGSDLSQPMLGEGNYRIRRSRNRYCMSNTISAKVNTWYTLRTAHLKDVRRRLKVVIPKKIDGSYW